jgi:hypothetical protein
MPGLVPGIQQGGATVSAAEVRKSPAMMTGTSGKSIHRLLALNCRYCCAMLLEIHELFDATLFGEARDQTLPMLVDPPDQIVRDAEVERTMTVLGKNVDLIDALPHSSTMV